MPRHPLRRACGLALALWWLAACAPLQTQGIFDPAPSTAPLPAPVAAPPPGPVVAAPVIAPAVSAELEILAQADAAAQRAPRPVKLIRTEGLLPSDPVAQASNAAKADWYAMYFLALAARQQPASGYGPALQRYFADWVAVFQPQFNPISETQFHWVALAYDVGQAQLTPATTASTAALLRRMAEGYLKPPRNAGTLSNNWQSHRVKLAATLAFALGDAQLIAQSRAAFQKQLGDNIGRDGAVIDFWQRDALHYVTYSLEPLLTAALVAQTHGENWYALAGSNGATLERALKWLSPYAGGEKQHEEFVRSGTAFDRTRAAAGVPGFSGLWNPKDAANCYQIAARLQPGWIPLAVWLGPQPAWLEQGFPSPAVADARTDLLNSGQAIR